MFVSKNKDCVQLLDDLRLENELDFEILALSIKLSDNCTEGKLVTYRSPSMRDHGEIELYIDRIDRYLNHMKSTFNFDVVTVIGDPNVESLPNKFKTQWKSVMAAHTMCNLIGDVPTRVDPSTGSETQPDVCYCKFDPSKVKVSARVIGKLCATTDHRMIRVYYDLKGVIPKRRQFFSFSKKVRNKSVSEDTLRLRLRNEIKLWMQKYGSFIAQSFTSSSIVERPRGSVHFESREACNKIVEEATVEFANLCERVWNYGQKTIRVVLPDNTPKNADRLDVKILRLSSLLAEFALLIRNEPDKLSHRIKFNRIEKEKCDLVTQMVANRVESNLKHSHENFGGSNKFYKLSNKYLSKDAFDTNCHANFTEADKREKLEKTDNTFKSNDPNVINHLEDYKNITPEFVFDLVDWCPGANMDGKDISDDIIKKLKLNKSDQFWKIFSDDIVCPVYVISRLIQFSGYFPLVLRKSRLSFLNCGRAIFSLEGFVKIVESILAFECDVCIRKFFLKHGNPLQMAYEKNCGTVVTNLINMTFADIYMHFTNKPLGQSFADLIKAFNSANRSAILKQMQKYCGCGDICFTRFMDRIYIFEDEIRGEGFDQGVDPGTPLAVIQFKLFILTDVMRSAFNTSVVFPNSYSDDLGLLVETREYINGNAQKNWDSSKVWADEMGVKYHVKPEDDKKHNYIVFKKRGMEVVDEMANLELEGYKFEEIVNVRQLGCNISVDKTREGATRVVNKRGYYFNLEVDSLKFTAYQLQEMKIDFSPTDLWKMVMGYAAGRLRYGMCLYWCRALPHQKDTARFYYAMAISSICKMNALQTLGGLSCKKMSVKEDNVRYVKLLELTGLPDLRHMAGKEAVAMIKQCSRLIPAFLVMIGLKLINVFLVE